MREIDKIIQEAMKKYDSQQDLSEEQLSIIKDKTKRINQHVISRLQNIEYDLDNTGVSTYYLKEPLWEDMESNERDVYISTFSSSLFPMHVISIITDAQTEEMLYVRTGPMTTVSIEQFFNREEG